MGTYTGIYESTRAVRARRSNTRAVSARPLSSAHPHEVGPPPAYRCAECGEGSAFASSCALCDVALQPIAPWIMVPGKRDKLAESRPFAPSFGLIVLPFVLFSIPWLWGAAVDQSGDSIPYSLKLALAVAVGGPLLFLVPLLFVRFVRWATNAMHRQNIWKAARRRADALVATRPGSAPSEANLLVRITGKVEINEGKLSVSSGGKKASVPVCTRLRVFASGTTQSSLRQGEAVEVVGVGSRRLGAGDGYRDTLGEFSFDPKHPIDVFVL